MLNALTAAAQRLATTPLEITRCSFTREGHNDGNCNCKRSISNARRSSATNTQGKNCGRSSSTRLARKNSRQSEGGKRQTTTAKTTPTAHAFFSPNHVAARATVRARWPYTCGQRDDAASASSGRADGAARLLDTRRSAQRPRAFFFPTTLTLVAHAISQRYQEVEPLAPERTTSKALVSPDSSDDTGTIVNAQRPRPCRSP